MLFFVPYGTDAPVYHFPYATIGLIVINALMFLGFCQDLANDIPPEFETPDGKRFTVEQLAMHAENDQDDEFIQIGDDSVDLSKVKPVWTEDNIGRAMMLSFGQGYRPWEWVTNMFMHAGWMHLIGNMIFLWSFGLVVEGKVGWLLLSSIYVAMGVVQSFVVQTIMFFAMGGHALGASSAIFALLAVAVIWAPRNNFDTLLLFGFRPFTFEVPILMFGFIYVAMNFAFWSLGGHGMGSEALHLTGFLIGIPVGFVMLQKGWVDCEGYDLISYWTGKEGKESDVGKKPKVPKGPPPKSADEENASRMTSQQAIATMQLQITEAIQEGNMDVAVAIQRKLAKSHPNASWQQPQLFAIIQAYLKIKDFAKAEPLMEEHIALFDKRQFAIQVSLVKLWLQSQRPRHALRYIDGMNPAFLLPEESKQLEPLVAYAKKQIAMGVLEVS